MTEGCASRSNSRRSRATTVIKAPASDVETVARSAVPEASGVTDSHP